MLTKANQPHQTKTAASTTSVFTYYHTYIPTYHKSVTEPLIGITVPYGASDFGQYHNWQKSEDAR